jgi:hypothetical protein
MATSPNSTILSRRTAIAAGFAMLSTLPALASGGDPDAELIELGRQLETIDIQYREASETSTRLLGIAESQ